MGRDRGWEPGSKWGGKCTGGGRREGGKRIFKVAVTRNIALYFAIEKAQRGRNQYKVQGTGSRKFRLPPPPPPPPPLPLSPLIMSVIVILLMEVNILLYFRNEKTKALLNSANSGSLMRKRRPSIPFVSYLLHISISLYLSRCESQACRPKTLISFQFSHASSC